MTDGTPGPGEGLAPVTVVTTRYKGVYEGGLWVAFNRRPYDLPLGWNGSDTVAPVFYTGHAGEVGVGDTPQAAYEDLCVRVLRQSAYDADEQSAREAPRPAEPITIARLAAADVIPWMAVPVWPTDPAVHWRDIRDQDVTLVRRPIGWGDTPGQAYLDLLARIGRGSDRE